MAQIADRFLRIEQPASQQGARIVRQRGQRHLHPVNLGLLIGVNLGGEIIQHRIAGSARQFEQVFHHRQRALVVDNHHLQEQPVKLHPARGGQCGHLFGRGHARHPGVVHVPHARHVCGLAISAKPFAHEIHLVLLRGSDARGGGGDHFIAGALGHQRGHFHRLLVVDDHPLHEGDIGRQEIDAGEPYRFLLAQHRGGLAGRSGADDLHLLRQRRCGGSEQHGGKGEGQRSVAASDHGETPGKMRSYECNQAPALAPALAARQYGKEIALGPSPANLRAGKRE